MQVFSYTAFSDDTTKIKFTCKVLREIFHGASIANSLL